MRRGRASLILELRWDATLTSVYLAQASSLPMAATPVNVQRVGVVETLAVPNEIAIERPAKLEASLTVEMGAMYADAQRAV